MPVADEHIPVLLEEVVHFLQPERGGTFLDATLGLGGHSSALLTQSPNLKLIGLDRDPEALKRAALRLESYSDRLTLIQGTFADIGELGLPLLSGILMDLGVSSMQLDTPERGFSFLHDGPLDMRMDPEGTVTAASIVNTWPEDKLANMIYEFGEERLSRRISRSIVERRRKDPFSTTRDLAELITSCYPAGARNKRPHPATRTFQALRMEVNQEIPALERGLDGAIRLLDAGGVLVVISFHSLEDRIVKYAFRSVSKDGEHAFEILTKKPVVATDAERVGNPRSRSAKLRAIRRIH